MVILGAIFILLLLCVWLFGGIWLLIHGKFLEKDATVCSECGGVITVKPDPPNSQLVMSCQNDQCDCVSYCYVRPSALSLFGITQLLVILFVGASSYIIADTMKFGSIFKILTVLGGAFLGAVIVRFFIRLIVFTLLQGNLSVAWQKEIVAYLAPAISREDAIK